MKTFTKQERQWIHQDYPGYPDNEIAKFIHRCEQSGLDPLQDQARLQKRKNTKTGVYSYPFLIQRNGHRVLAERTGLLDGLETTAAFEDGRVMSATTTVWRKDRSHPHVKTCYMQEYYDDRSPIWKSKPVTMLEKVSEVACLSMAFPFTGGMYMAEELPYQEEEEKEDATIDHETGDHFVWMTEDADRPLGMNEEQASPGREEVRARAKAQALHIRLTQEGVDEKGFSSFLINTNLLQSDDKGEAHLRNLGDEKLSEILQNFADWKKSFEEYSKK